MEILELHGVEGRGYYIEGNSEVVNVLEGGGTWFCFETMTFAEAAMELQKIGFTATQILEALPTFTALDAEEAELADDRPWGEQQGQIDWLESRFDVPGEDTMFDTFGDAADFDPREEE